MKITLTEIADTLSGRTSEILNCSIISSCKNDVLVYRIQESQTLRKRNIVSASKLNSQFGWNTLAGSIGYSTPYFVFEVKALKKNILIDIDALFSRYPTLERNILSKGGNASEMVERIKLEKEVLLLNDADNPLIINTVITVK